VSVTLLTPFHTLPVVSHFLKFDAGSDFGTLLQLLHDFGTLLQLLHLLV
jgi:hypothetical protein